MSASVLQVKGYLQHLSRMNLTVDQLSKTGIGKRLRGITKWGNQRKSALEPMPAAQEADPETGDPPERRPSWELAMCALSCLFPRQYMATPHMNQLAPLLFGRLSLPAAGS
jgi:hypothetical protein